MGLSLAVIKLWTDEVIEVGSTNYTPSVRFARTTGFANLHITSSAGSITITQQTSSDDITWCDVIDQSGASLGAVVSSMTVGTKCVQFPPVMGTYTRFKVVEGAVAQTTVSLNFSFQEQNN